MRRGLALPYAAFAVFATFTSVSGCKLRHELPDDADERRRFSELARRAVDQAEPAAPDDAEPAAPAIDRDVLLGKKLDALVRECRNPFSTRALQSWTRYQSWIADKKTGPTGRERTIFGLYSITAEPKSCRKAVEEARRLDTDTVVLDLASVDFAKALEALVPAVNAASLYYEQGDYKDDACARGRAMHADLVAAFDAFKKADAALAAEIDEAQDALDARELVRLEGDESQRGAWHVKCTVVLAKSVLRAGSVEVAKIDLRALEAAHSAFADALSAMTKWSDAHASEAAALSSYARNLAQLELAAKELEERVRAKRPFTTGERMNLGGQNEWMVQGSPGRLVARYNAAIEAYNALPGVVPR